mgnify:CR=1 FL=1
MAEPAYRKSRTRRGGCAPSDDDAEDEEDDRVMECLAEFAPRWEDGKTRVPPTIFGAQAYVRINLGVEITREKASRMLHDLGYSFNTDTKHKDVADDKVFSIRALTRLWLMLVCIAQVALARAAEKAGGVILERHLPPELVFVTGMAAGVEAKPHGQS